MLPTDPSSPPSGWNPREWEEQCAIVARLAAEQDLLQDTIRSDPNWLRNTTAAVVDSMLPVQCRSTSARRQWNAR